MFKLPYNCVYFICYQGYAEKVLQARLQQNLNHELPLVQTRFQQYMNQELPDVQTEFGKGRGIRDQIANICWIIEKQEIPEKHLLHWLC